MSAIKDIVFDIQDELDSGELSYEQIAVKYGVSVADVKEIEQELIDNEVEYEPDCDDSDDGYALASAGMGTDEDYVCDNDYFDDY